jgi:Holliday junction resolvase
MKQKKVSEKWVKTQVVKMLKEIGAYYFYPVASGYMSIGVPDIVACVKGRFIGIECKAGSNQATPLQLKNLKDIVDNGGISVLVNEDALVELKKLLQEI